FLGKSFEGSVKLLHTPSDDTIWTQDYFETAINTTTKKFTIFDLPYRTQIGEHVPTAIAMACHADLIAQANQSAEQTLYNLGDLGGNIEAVNDRLVFVGKNISRAQKKILKARTAQEFVELRVNWLDVGHVDEILSLIPKKGTHDTQCGFDILYASPGLALNLIKEAPADEKAEPLEMRFGFDKSLESFNLWDCAKTPSKIRGCRLVFEANQAYEKIMQQNLIEMKNAVKTIGGCKNVNFIPIPALFSAKSESNVYGTPNDKAVSIEPNPLNNILLGHEILVPKQHMRSLHEYTEGVLNKYDLDVNFVEGGYVHAFSGGIHCATNVRYGCK
ncbi:MAG: hypothetical protein KDD25_09135, partial [Bdellovibrionales bacterium]|nr:hypothetical protein [Bdellovibrionales bacterium]